MTDNTQQATLALHSQYASYHKLHSVKIAPNPPEKGPSFQAGTSTLLNGVTNDV